MDGTLGKLRNPEIAGSGFLFMDGVEAVDEEEDVVGVCDMDREEDVPGTEGTEGV